MPEAFAYPCDLEEAAFQNWLLAPETPTDFEDAVYARTADAVLDHGSGRSSPLDCVALLRHVVRRWSERDGRPATMLLPTGRGLDSEDLLRAVGMRVLDRSASQIRADCVPFAPPWLEGEPVIDGNAVAGTGPGERAVYQRLPADPIFLDATGFATYRSAGQRSAVRAAVGMPEDGTLIALLPTGSGKTEIAVVVAHLARRRTTLIVVPTVALAYDFERRFRHVVARLQPRAREEDLDFAWTNETDGLSRERFKSLLIQGRLPFLVISPESMSGALLNTLRSAAEGGRLAALVVDEAHLVTQWGRDFRPEFRQLSNLRRDLLSRARASGHEGFKTILLSATLGEPELTDLVANFVDEGRGALVAANVLRPEPDYWVAPTTERDVRDARVLEAITRLPRPLILYVTSPAAAERWADRIRQMGFVRAAAVTGNTPGLDRRDVLHGLRAGAGCRSSYDVVVATSAFGLGIDNDQIRSVVHACLPETVDRWYQEVGRAGRDGHASVALLLPAHGDRVEAASLGVTMLRPETAHRRWATMWQRRVDRDRATYVDLHSTPRESGRGSYSRRWNAQVLRGLQELGQIERRQLSIDRAAALELPLGDPDDPHEWEQITLLAVDAQSPEYFEDSWEPWRLSLLEDSRTALDAMTQAAEPAASVCWLLANAYDPGPEIRQMFGVSAVHAAPLADCGRCPGCRASGVEAHAPDLPSVPNRWPATDVGSPALERLMASAPTGAGLALILESDLKSTAAAFASALVRHGVRFLAGVEPEPADARRHIVFVDGADVALEDVPPVPALVVPAANESVDQRWLVSSERAPLQDGEPSPVIMLVSPMTPVGASRRPARELPHLDLDVAMAILGAR